MSVRKPLEQKIHRELQDLRIESVCHTNDCWCDNKLLSQINDLIFS
mgnify:CR=1 FL=1